MSTYAPIEDYGAIGNLRTVALVGLDGAIDWCCLPNLDSPSVFAALLDHERGGRFRVAPERVQRREQRYLEGTNVLETIFDGEHGRLVVVDFMPLAGSIDGCGGSRTENAVYRLLRAEGGPVEVVVEWVPRFDYAQSTTKVMRTPGGFLAWGGKESLALAGVADGLEVAEDALGQFVRGRFELRPGERRALVTRWGADALDVTLDAAQASLEETVATWRGWLGKEEASGDRSWAGAHREQVIRSELALKLLTHANTGAIAAAATTSLPEHLGGVRNWDYRYSWIRDAALSAQALFALGHRADAEAFVGWAERVAKGGEHEWGLQIVYGLDGEKELEEKDLPQLEGYRRSAPVRVGNGAVDQLQLDIYGELISAAYELHRLGGRLDGEVRDFLPHVADQACANWQTADYGLWEIRNGPYHFVYSKVMVWMALDRALRLEREGVIRGDADRWRRTRRRIREEVLERGFDPELGAFRQSYERSVLDASNLLFPLQEFLPFDDPRVRSNLDRTLEGLTENGLVYRYKADDGVAGTEGAFGLCTFWLVDALALSDRLDEAHETFEGMLSRANHLRLFSEQIDPATGAYLGNYPQAFTHLGLINSALYLAHQEGRETPVPAPIGSDAHREEGGEEG
jgi:GH15 family glucan-1,4-alpha-glucosidase